MTAEDRGWGQGFPASRAADMKTIKAGGIRVTVHEDIAELVAYLLDETVRRGYRLKPGECWGYANRPIRGSHQPSNHSWGLAVDLNSPSNPMGDKLITDMPPWMPALWKAWGFTWGGSYSGRKDAMHYEFTGTPKDARTFTAKVHIVQDAPVTVATAASIPPVKMEVVARMNIAINGIVVDVLKAPGGGVWQLLADGSVYAWECPDHGAPNRHPEYWADRKAARLEPLGGGYVVIDSTGARYEYPAR